jgi:Tol biopolymer transport system component
VVCITNDEVGKATALYTVSSTGLEAMRVLPVADEEDFGPPTWSSDGRITLWRGAAGQRQGRRGGNLIAVDPGTREIDTLTLQRDTHPDWDGNDRLVFLRRGPDATRVDQILVLDLAEFQRDGTGTTLLTQGFVSNPTWSPDGERIAYLARDNADDDWRLMLMNDDGSDAHPVELSEPAGIPSWGSR